jgi:hypothetical protein
MSFLGVSLVEKTENGFCCSKGISFTKKFPYAQGIKGLHLLQSFEFSLFDSFLLQGFFFMQQTAEFISFLSLATDFGTPVIAG